MNGLKEMALEAQLPHNFYTGEPMWMDRLETFAKLVAAKEREEIAQFIESTELGSLPEATAIVYARLLKSYSTAIRARS